MASMMMNSWKGATPKIVSSGVALLLFFVVAALYFSPQFHGEVLPQHDVQQYEGMSRDIKNTRQSTGEDPQWTGGMFGGMPAYLITVEYPAQTVKTTVGRLVYLLDSPAAFLFFAMTAMWLMLLIMGVNPWVGIVPALAYGLSTYFLLIIGAGHITKMWALVYAPLMMGGAWMTLRGNIWLGGALTALFTSLEIGANHPQITYYFLLALLALWISELVMALRGTRLKGFITRTAILAVAGIFAVGSNFSPLWYTLQHTKETMRGGSELTATTPGQSSSTGLALDYATAWSYGKAESFNMLIPNFMGGESATTFSSDGAVADALKEYGFRGAEQQLPAYWGTQPYTGGPTYLGAVAIFLAAIGIGLTRGRNKWWIVGVSVLSILLAWGSNLMGFTELFFKYFPGYNKFRTVSMILVVVQWSVPLLAALGLMQLWRGETPRRQLLHTLGWAAGITGGLCLLFALAGGSLFDFGRDASAETLTGEFQQALKSNGMEKYVQQGLHEQMALTVADAMSVERAQIMSADAWRSLLFILFAAGAVLLYALRKINKYLLMALLGVAVVVDLVTVDMRYLSHENFTSPRRQQLTATAADQAIMQDTDPGYRVFNLTVSPFNDATTSYFHRSVGGYHGAKLARYQDIIDHYLSRQDPGVLDMLNTRYLIVPGQEGAPQAVRRATANGAAWFVDSLLTVTTPQQEIEGLAGIDTKHTALTTTAGIRKPTGTGEIELVEYQPHKLRYRYTSEQWGVALFSEIFYDKGWTAYIDGQEAPYFRADYILRAMQLPAGSHTVEWRFRAPHWQLVEGITLFASLAILLAVLTAGGLLFWRWRQGNKQVTV